MATTDTLGFEQLVPQQQNPSISEFIAPQTFQPIIVPFTGAPEIKDNISYLDNKFQEIDKAQNEYDLLKTSINRLAVDDPYVKEALTQYDIDPTLVNDAYAGAKIKQKARQFQADLKDPTTIVGAAQMNYNAEKAMEAQLNKLVMDEKLDAERARRIMDNYRDNYRSTGGVQDSQGNIKSYPLFQSPATVVDEIKVVNDAVKDWAKNKYGKETAYARPISGGRYIITGKDGKEIAIITAQEVKEAITPILRQHGGIEAYHRQTGQIQTYGKSPEELRMELIASNQPRGKGDIKRIQRITELYSTNDSERLKQLAEDYAYEDAIENLTNLGVAKTELYEEAITQDRGFKESSQWSMLWKANREREDAMQVAFGASGKFTKSYKADEIHKNLAESNKELTITGQQLDSFFKSKGGKKSDGTAYTVQEVAELIEAPAITNEFILREVFNGDQDAMNVMQQYYQSNKRNQTVQRNYDRVAKLGGFDADVVIGEARKSLNPLFTSYVDRFMGQGKVFTEQDLLNAVKSGMSYEEFKKQVLSKAPDSIKADFEKEEIQGGFRGVHRLADSPLEDMYDEVMIEYEASAQKGYGKGIDKQYTLLKGLGSDANNFYEQNNTAYTELVTSGAQELRDNGTGVVGDYQRLLGKALGKTDDEIKTMDFNNVKVTATGDIGFEDKPVLVVTGEYEGNIVKVPVVMEGKGAYTNTLNIIEKGIRNLGGFDKSHITKTHEELMKQYLGSSLKGGYQNAQLDILGVGQTSTIKLPSGHPFVNVERTNSGYRVSLPTGQKMEGVFPSLESLQAGLGIMLYKQKHKEGQ